VARYFIYSCLSEERKALVTRLGERAAGRLAEVAALEVSIASPSPPPSASTLDLFPPLFPFS